jgi:two-component system CheB/CheR fusion protein
MVESAAEESGSRASAIVGIGASAGGLEALEELFSSMPGDTGAAFVVVTHLHPDHKSLLPELLARITGMPVLAAAHDLAVEPNHIYVGLPGGQLSIRNGRLQRLERDESHSPKMPINFFLRSLAQDQRERAVCIILSGTGSDGTLGLQEIKAQAGMVMVERPQSARHAGMPTSAIATGMADFVLAPAAMPEQLIRYIHAPFLSEASADTPAHEMAEGPLQEIFALLRRRTGHDFSEYKSNTIHRRIARRMNVHQIEGHQQYVRYLKESPEEADVLFKELLINVTNFFRDPQAWDVLATSLAALVSSRPDGSTLRIWVPGCSSGEEVFSIAILLHECMDESERQLDVQIFGTDLDSRAIDKARTGLYEEGIADDLTPQRLATFFTREKGGYRIRKDIRDMTVFAPQNVIKDPPFTQMDLISCRNLMIYLNASIQKKLLPMFHYALRPGGLLFLGSSESTGSFSDLFEPLDKRWKIFRRKEGETGRQLLPDFTIQSPGMASRARPLAAARLPGREANMQHLIEHALLSRFVPASVIIDAKGDIVYVHGRTGAYLEPSEGQPRNNILEMAREGLQMELAEAMRQCLGSDTEIRRNSIRIDSNGGGALVDISVVKLEQPEALRDLLLVSFRPTPSTADVAGPEEAVSGAKVDNGEQVEQLERTLRFLRETHYATLEELETSNEELESTNEELQSTNEELQSTNEELETSKEEMQSLNEELTTVNSELQSKLEDLSQANDDMQNLLNSTKIATVFLDSELKIKRFTDQARELIMLRETDVGRPISELASKLRHEDLAADCRSVLRTLVFREAEVITSDDTIYLMRIMPYRTARNAIDGLVLTFVDISGLKRAQKDLRHMTEVFQEGADPTIIVNLRNEIIDLNEQAMRSYGYSPQEVVGKSLFEIIPQRQREMTAELIDRCRGGAAVRTVPWSLHSRASGDIPVLLTLHVLTGERGEADAIALVARKSDEQGPG